MKKMILGIAWQLMGFLGSIAILCSAAVHQWDYNGITGVLGSLLGLDLINSIYCLYNTIYLWFSSLLQSNRGRVNFNLYT